MTHGLYAYYVCMCLFSFAAEKWQYQKIGLACSPYLQKIVKQFYVRGTRQHALTKAFMHCGLPKNVTSYYVVWHGVACRSQIAPPFSYTYSNGNSTEHCIQLPGWHLEYFSAVLATLAPRLQ